MPEEQSPIAVTFLQPPPELQPYLTALYLTEINVPDGEWIVDYLHPERAALRFTDPTPPRGRVGAGELEERYRFTANGPTSQSVWFSISRARCWGIGLQPAGWARFIDVPADALADTIVDGNVEPAFAPFAGLTDIIFGERPDAPAEARRIVEHLLAMEHRPVPHEEDIFAVQEAIRDPDLADVAGLARAVGLSSKSLGRLCKRYFGFKPSLLLRRQRFLRSLAQFMLEPNQNWSSALDGQYYDQAQFNRDFHQFMGMKPSDYAKLPHPIINPIMRPRMADLGAAKPIELPTVLRYDALEREQRLTRNDAAE